jgi:hypothetical protein
MHRGHRLTREQEIRKIILDCKREFQDHEPKTPEELEEERKEWWQSYFKGVGIIAACFVVF